MKSDFAVVKADMEATLSQFQSSLDADHIEKIGQAQVEAIQGIEGVDDALLQEGIDLARKEEALFHDVLQRHGWDVLSWARAYWGI